MVAVATLAITRLTGVKPVEQRTTTDDLPAVEDAWVTFFPNVSLARAPVKQPVSETGVIEVSSVLAKIQETQPGRDASDFLPDIITPERSTLFDRQLTVNVPADLHDAIVERLTQLAESGHWEVQFKVRCIDVALDQVMSAFRE